MAAGITIACSSPTAPSLYVATVDVRYVRAVTPQNDLGPVAICSDIPIAGDALHRSRLVCPLSMKQIDQQTFVSDVPFQLPIGLESTFWIQDPAVGERVARDIYVNGTKLRIEDAGGWSYGKATITKDGVIH